MAAVSEIITKFSFQGSTKPLKDYNNSLGESIKLLGAMGAAFGAATFAVAKWASGVSQSLQPLFDLSEQTGVAVASLQELSFAAEQSGSSSQALESSISGLSAKIGEAAQKGSEEFSRLGISVRDANGNVKDADAILGEVGNSFKRLGLSMSEQQGYAEALGIDPSLISMLSQTSAETDKLKQRARDLGITLSPEDKKGLKEYNESISEMDSAMSGLKNQIAVAIVPELEGLAEGFSDLLAKNNEWIVDGVEATVEFVVDLVDALKRLAPFILATGAAFAIATIGTSGFAAALGFVLSPAVLITAGILAIALVLDDLIVAFRGGDSVIANFFEEFFGWDIQPLLKDIVAVFKEVVGGILGGAKIIFDALKPIAPLIAVVGAAFVAATVGPTIFAGALALITSPITLIIAGVAGILWAVNDLSKAFKGGESVIANFFEEFFGWDIQPLLEDIVAVFKEVVGGILGGAKIIFDALKPIAPLIAVVGAAFVAATVGPALFAGALALITSPITLILAGVAGILWAVNDLSKALSGGESVIADFFQEFFGWDILPVLEGIVDVFKYMWDVLEPFAPLIAVVGAAFAAAAVFPALFGAALALATSPITLIIAGIAAVVWIINDLIKAFQGGDSVIASFFEEFLGFDIQPVLKKIVSGFKNAFNFVTDLVSNLFGDFMSIFSGIGKLLSGDFLGGFTEIGEGLMGIVGTLSDAFFALFGDLFKWVGQKVLDILPDWAVKLIGGAGDAASAAAGMAGDAASGMANIVGDAVSGAANIVGDVGNWVGGVFGGEDMIPKSQAMQPGGAVTNVGGTSSRVEQTVNMEIRTSDPERAGKAAADNLQRQMDDARTQSRRGGM